MSESYWVLKAVLLVVAAATTLHTCLVYTSFKAGGTTALVVPANVGHAKQQAWGELPPSSRLLGEGAVIDLQDGWPQPHGSRSLREGNVFRLGENVPANNNRPRAKPADESSALLKDPVFLAADCSFIIVGNGEQGPLLPDATEEKVFCCALPKVFPSDTSVGKANKLNMYKTRVQEGNSDLYCLPNFIIAGTQKSGTTALAAMMEQHPQIRMAPRKELHYFDRPPCPQADPRIPIDSHRSLLPPDVESALKARYARMFPTHNGFNVSAMQEDWSSGSVSFVSGEATPYYLASPVACRNMAALVPHARLLVLLRDPVQRAFSEYQMKLRRVNDQDAFIRYLSNSEIAGRVRKCLVSAEALDVLGGGNANRGAGGTLQVVLSEISKCIGEEIQLKAKWGDFFQPIIMYLRKLTTALTQQRRDGNPKKSFADSLDYIARTCFPLAEHYREKPRRDEGTFRGPYADWGGKMPLKGLPRGLVERSNGRQVNGTDVAVETSDWGLDSGNYTFNSFCYTRFESYAKLWEIMWAEMESMQTCFNTAKEYAGNSTDDLAAFEMHIERCVKPNPGITNQYIYRSLYAVQLLRCIRHIPLDQIMVIESDELKTSPQTVLPAIHAHLGVQNFEYGNVTEAAIQEQLEKIYPGFEKKTGWRLHSKYSEELPGDLEWHMRKFFKPHNEMLFKLLNTTFPWPDAG